MKKMKMLIQIMILIRSNRNKKIKTNRKMIYLNTKIPSKSMVQINKHKQKVLLMKLYLLQESPVENLGNQDSQENNKKSQLQKIKIWR